MNGVTKPDLQKKIDDLMDLGQQHIFKYWDELDANKRKSFIRQLESIDVNILKKQIDLIRQDTGSAAAYPKLKTANVLSLKERQFKDPDALALGEAALSKGQVAVFLVAGGQGSRLGFNGPKGAFPVSPVKHKSLFQLFAEKIQYLQNKYGSEIPWYIMTSGSNHEQTRDFFLKNNFFGLNAENVRFFIQDMLPTLDQKGKLILIEKSRLFFNPNGHGGSLSALYKNGALQEMLATGRKQLFYFQVDNVLVNMCDPLFLGYHIGASAEMSTKVIRKLSAEERMGIICKVDGRDGVVEYSDLSQEDMFAKNNDGSLKYWAGNTAIHMFNVKFLLEQAQSSTKLPFHPALKNIQLHSGDHSSRVGIKFEMFIFDLLKNVRNSLVLEVDRKKEFSAVKNKQGADSPETAKNDLLWNYANMLKAAGFKIDCDKNGLPLKLMEISPLRASSAEDLKKESASISILEEDCYLG